MKVSCLAASALICFFFSPARADVVTSLGNTASTLVNGTKVTGAAVLTAQSGQPAPFNGPCGSDANTNCSTSWTFNYTLGLGQTVDGATLTLGLVDIDSAAPGNQVHAFTLTGGDDMTVAFNALSEALDGTGSPNSFYDILSITIPSTSFTVLDSGAATFNLTLQGPGLGAVSNLPAPPDNGASLIFSTLDLTTQTVASTPEPSTWCLLLAGIVGMILFRARARKPS